MQQDVPVADQLSKAFDCYTDGGKPLRTITVCQVDNCREANKIDDDDVAIIRKSVDALCFASSFQISRDHILDPQRSTYFSPQHFQLVRHSSKVGSNSFLLNLPYACIINCNYDMRFERPLALGGCPAVIDHRMVETLSRLLASDNNALVERVSRTLEWTRLSHDDTGAVSNLSKVVMMGTAFEILLQITDRAHKRKQLVDKLDSLCKTRNSVLRRARLDKKKAPEEHCAMAWWACRFYELRNAIVHSGKAGRAQLFHTPPKAGAHPGVSRLQVADVVLAECIWRLLFEARIVGDDCRRLAAVASLCGGDELDIARDYAPLYAGTKEVVETLRWRRQSI